MNKAEVLNFIAENNNEIILDYYNKSYDKLKDMNRRSEKITLYLIFIVFLYFIISRASISTVSIGPVSITDLSVISCLLPVLFAYFLFEYLVLSNHKSNLFTTVKLLFLSIYKQPVDKAAFDNTSNSLITRMILPYSLTIELSKFRVTKFSIINSGVGILLVFPFLSLIFLPFYFEFYMLREIYWKYMPDTFSVICFSLSIYLMCLMVYHFINNAFVDHGDKIAELK